MDRRTRSLSWHGRASMAAMLIIDAANVVGSRPTGWWRDRPKAARDFVASVRSAIAAGRLSEPVVVVLEGKACDGAEAGVGEGVDVVHARGDGDDTIVELAVGSASPVTVVTADRGLRDRVSDTGGTVVGPRWLLARLGQARTR